MTIYANEEVKKPKFSLNQEVYFIDDNQIMKGKVTGVFIRKKREANPSLKYYCYDISYDEAGTYAEIYLFATLEDLLQSLKVNYEVRDEN